MPPFRRSETPFLFPGSKKSKLGVILQPFTSTLQQEAANELHFSAKRTMQIAQRLYEGINVDGETVGLITYMRTDGVSMAQEAITPAATISVGNMARNTYLPLLAFIRVRQKCTGEPTSGSALRYYKASARPDCPGG